MELPRLLMTGINGLIGSILRKGLDRAFDIYGLDCAGPFSDRIFEANIREYDQIADVFRRIGPFEYLIHLAANPRADADWDSVLNDNIVGTRNVFEAAREFGVRRVVFASSNHVTGAYEGFEPHQRLHEEHEPTLITIEDPIRPDGYYGVSKAFGEALARYYCARWGIEFVCLRIGLVLRDDDPTVSRRFRKTWLSHRDLVQLVEKGLKSYLTFGIYYGVSNNKLTFWDIFNARRELGYSPEDDASTLTS